MADFADIRGQAPAIESLVTAIASGARRILLVGSPGLGLEMFAARVPTLFPPLIEHERMWLQAEHEGDCSPYHPPLVVTSRPFMAPHTTISSEALLGGRVYSMHTREMCRDMPGILTTCRCRRALPAHQHHALPDSLVARAGMVQLARFGVLALHPIDAFSPDLLRSLARCLDGMTGAPFIIAGATPCPCGWHGSWVRDCICGERSREQHAQSVQKRIAILEVSAKVEIPYVSLREMRDLSPGESSASLRGRIEAIRAGRTAEGSEP